jgi:hypothetical protein
MKGWIGKRGRAARWSLLALIFLSSSMGATNAHASTSLASLFQSVCVSVYDLAHDREARLRTDLADQVVSGVQTKIHMVEQDRSVKADPRCIKEGQPGFERQLLLKLSIKRQSVSIRGQEWNAAVAGGVSPDGFFQERDYQPTLIVQREPISDERVVKALIDFVDRSVIEAIRRR